MFTDTWWKRGISLAIFEIGVACLVVLLEGLRDGFPLSWGMLIYAIVGVILFIWGVVWNLLLGASRVEEFYKR
jgi:hypothetical protein